MRYLLASFWCCGVLALAFAGDEPKKADEKDKPVREIELKDVTVKVEEGGRGGFGKPTKITSKEELAKYIPDEKDREAIGKQVDFSKQNILLFAWSGSGQDKITPALKQEEKGLVAIFIYRAGLTRDLRQHRRLFAINKDMEFKNANTFK